MDNTEYIWNNIDGEVVAMTPEILESMRKSDIAYEEHRARLKENKRLAKVKKASPKIVKSIGILPSPIQKVYHEEKRDRDLTERILRGKEKLNLNIQVTVDNFFQATIGEWNEIKELPEGFNSIFKSKGSEYFTKDGSEIIRISDHWGHSIRFCTWYLKGYSSGSSRNWKKKYGPDKKIGIIHINDLHMNTKKYEAWHKWEANKLKFKGPQNA